MCGFSWDVEVLYCKQMYREVGAEEAHRERVDRRRGYGSCRGVLDLQGISVEDTFGSVHILPIVGPIVSNFLGSRSLFFPRLTKSVERL